MKIMSYIAVLDYKNKKSYLTRTDIFAGLGGRDEQVKSVGCYGRR